MDKMIYHYDPQTHEYIGASKADESPLEPGVTLIPADATEIEPPGPQAGLAPVFRNGEWHEVEDLRGTTYWDAMGIEQLHTVLGLLPEGALISPPPPEPVVPHAVSRFQARAALHLAGLLDQVEALMVAPETDMLARLAWQDAQEFRRHSPTVAAMGAALGLDDAQLDALFTTAAGIEA